jgi:hypothetical protein
MQNFDHKHFTLGKSIFSIYSTINLFVEDLDGVEEGESEEDIGDGGIRRSEGSGTQRGPGGGQ